MVAEIFSQPTRVTRGSFLFPDVELFSSHPLDSGGHNVLQALDVGLRIESETI